MALLARLLSLRRNLLDPSKVEQEFSQELTGALELLIATKVEQHPLLARWFPWYQ